MKPEIKKLLILNLPYLLFVYLFDKAGAAVRLSPGMDASPKNLELGGRASPPPLPAQPPASTPPIY